MALDIKLLANGHFRILDQRLSTISGSLLDLNHANSNLFLSPVSKNPFLINVLVFNEEPFKLLIIYRC